MKLRAKMVRQDRQKEFSRKMSKSQCVSIMRSRSEGEAGLQLPCTYTRRRAIGTLLSSTYVTLTVKDGPIATMNYPNTM